MRKGKKGLQIIILMFVALTLILAGCNSKQSSSGNSNSSNSEGNVTSSGNSSQTENNEGEPQKGGELTVSYLVDITNFDPIKGTTGNDFALLYPVYDPLVKLNPDLEPEPGLATSWEVLDEKTIVLNLREEVTFHDGTPFNAEAVKFNIERANSQESQVTDLKNIESVEVVNDHTVKLHLSQPDSTIVVALSMRGGMMVSPTAVTKYGADYPQHPVGAGAFTLSKHVLNGEIVYEAYDNYWNEGKPYLDKLTFKVIPDVNSQINALKSGQVDFVPGVEPQMVQSLKKNPNIVVTERSALGFNMLYLNTAREPLNNKDVRLAILYGINREELVNAINFGLGEPSVQPFPKDYWAYDDSINITYDPEKSKQLLNDAGLTDVSFTLLTYPVDYWTRLANAIKGQLEKVGITVEVEAMEPNSAVQRFLVDKTHDALAGNWGGTPDPQITINGLFSLESFYNTGKSMTPKLESLMLEGGTTYDLDKRAELYGAITKEAIAEQGFIIPLFTSVNINAYDEKIKGFNPSSGSAAFSDLWIDQK